MRYWLTIVAMAVFCCLFSPVTPAQTSRPVVVTLDTVRLNVCGAKEFLMPVSIGDIPLQDSLVGGRIYLAWDVLNLEFDDLVIASTETIANQFSERRATRNREAGTMFIEMGNVNLRPVAGSGKPLFYLSGRVISPDTVDGQYGWVQVLSAAFESAIRYDPVDLSHAGLVQVVRDTTPGFTGVLTAGITSFDTLRSGTASLRLQNVGNRRVKEVRFVVKADTNNYYFADTVETGTLAGALNWRVKEVSITPEAIEGRLERDTALAADGELIRIALRRKNDSAFTSTLAVDRFTVNRETCLGKLVRQSGQVSAEAIPGRDTSTSGIVYDAARRGESIRVIPELQGNAVMIVAGEMEVQDVAIFNSWGLKFPAGVVERIDASTLRVRFEIPPPSGTYFVALRDRNGIAYKQFTIIK